MFSSDLIKIRFGKVRENMPNCKPISRFSSIIPISLPKYKSPAFILKQGERNNLSMVGMNIFLTFRDNKYSFISLLPDFLASAYGEYPVLSCGEISAP